jgi:hypothetical protein
MSIPRAAMPRMRQVWRLAAPVIAAAFIGGCSSYTVSNTTPPSQPTPVGSLTIAPQGPCVAPAGAQQFTANLTNLTGSGVNWSVDSVPGGNATVGTITGDGLYGAPSASGQHTIQAVSQTDSKASASTTISVTAAPGFAVSPDSATLPASAQQSFQGQTCGVPEPNVAWSVDGVSGGNPSAGTITADGIYTAPAAPGSHTVQATELAHSKTDTAAVTVSTSGIVVDFGSRTNTQHPIPAGILGVNHVDWWYGQAQEAQVAQAGFTVSRTYAKLSDIYATTTPNWAAIDPQMTKLQATGFHVLLQLAFTPSWLQPSPNSCTGDKTKAPPASAAKWAQLVKSIVAHLDAKFPGVVTDYEIWNEPDSGGMCGTSNKLNSYLAMYAAAAPLIKQQAAADGHTVRVGGPASSSMNPTWFQAILTNASTAPYVDFVSYHQYFAGSADLNATWDTYNGTTPIYPRTQNSSSGAAAIYASAVKTVSAGKQPHPTTTPVYVDEFNTNWAFKKECCRNDPTYSPVFNALYVSDAMNTVYSGTSHVPGQLTYYAAVSEPGFCVLGDWDANMDCSHASGAPVPYPQYYAYELMASAGYLAMNSGGYMAASVSPASNGSGLIASAFYTAKQDSILIVNPTGNSYSQTLSIHNPGFSSLSAMLYKIVGGRSISKASLSLTGSGTTYTAPLTIPPYTVVGIAIK